MNAQLDMPRIPLQQLQLSPRNARKTTTRDVEDLAASIATPELGLLQNLTVTQSADGHYEVVAGGRRLAALQLLASRRALPASLADGIPCRIIDNDDAIEASTAENTLREAMHPADQFDAFKAMVDAKKPIDDVAAHFGVAPIVVKQRLKLANVAPDLLQVYRDGDMDLEQLQALAITEDHDAQRQAWNVEAWDRHPRTIRHRLTRSEVPGHHAVARFTGIDAYEAAGGKVRHDLFSDDPADVWLQDPALLDRLALDKLEAIAQAMRDDGWSWAEAHLQLDYAQAAEYPRLPEPEGDVQYATPEDAARVAEITARIAEIEAIDADDLDEDQEDALAREQEEIHDELGGIEDRASPAWPEEIKNVAGALVYLTRDGTLRVDRGRLRPGQRLDKASGDVTGKAKPSAADKAKQKPKKAALSQDMEERLALHRAAALRETIACKGPRLPLELLACELATKLLRDRGSYLLDIQAHNIHARTATGGNVSNKGWEDVRRAPARKALDDRIANLAALGMPKQVGAVLPWLQELSDNDLDTVLATCTVLMVNNLRGPQLASLCNQLEVDMRSWWQADAEHYTAQVSKALVLEAVAEACGKDAVAKVANLKKDALAAEAAKLLAGTGWLPKPLRGSGYALAKPAAATAKAAEAKGKKPAAKKAAAPARKSATRREAKAKS